MRGGGLVPEPDRRIGRAITGSFQVYLGPRWREVLRAVKNHALAVQRDHNAPKRATGRAAEAACASHPDTDDDGLTDGDEVHTNGFSPTDADSDDGGLTDGEEVNTYHTDPNDADTDDGLLSDGLEVKYGTDPLNPDTDGDGLPDGKDVEWIQGVIAAMPASAINPPGGGNRNAMMNQLDQAEAHLLKGKTTQALQKLSTLRAHIDGCGTAPDNNDWIKDCAIPPRSGCWSTCSSPTCRPRNGKGQTSGLPVFFVVATSERVVLEPGASERGLVHLPALHNREGGHAHLVACAGFRRCVLLARARAGRGVAGSGIGRFVLTRCT